MFRYEKIANNKTVLGLYAVITRGKSPNQRWRVQIGFSHYGPFRTKKQALQEARHQLLNLLSVPTEKESTQ